MEEELPLILTRHAQRRMAQRNLSVAEIRFIQKNGIRIHRAGVTAYFLGKRQLRHLDRMTAKTYAHLADVLVLCCPHCASVITAYHNDGGLRKLRQKSKYNYHIQRCVCSFTAHHYAA